MITEIIAFLAFLSIVRGVRLVWIKRKYYDQKPDPRARTIYHKKGKIGVLLLHGFTSSPLDMKPMAEYLAKKNITVLAPLLKGHGTTPENLATTTYDQWKQDAIDAYNKLRKETDKVFVVGHSFGGNLAIDLAGEHKVDGLVSLATPIFFQKHRFVQTSSFVIGLFKLFQKKKYTKYYLEKLNPKRFVYTIVPFNCAKHVVKGLKNTMKSLDKVRCPILIMQPRNDESISDKSVDYIYKKTKSKKKKIIWLNKTNHLFVLDEPANKEVFKEIYKFIRDEVNHTS